MDSSSTNSNSSASASGLDDETVCLARAILGFLDEEFRKPTTTTDSRESLEVGMQCLETAFGVSLRDHKSQNRGLSLREIYHSYRSGGPIPTAPTSNAATSPLTNPRTQPAAQQAPMDFSHLAAGMSGLNAGGAGGGIRAVEIPLGEQYTPPSTVTDVQKRQGDELKETGNRLMKEGEFSAALEIYNRALDLDASNAVYFCNRAAAYLKVGDLVNALRDVQIAVQLQPDYARAYGRMGVIYSTMGKNLEAYSCYKKAVELDPSNESYLNNLKVSQDLIEKSNGPGSVNRGPDPIAPFTQMFQNPQLMAMASQMLQDPGMQNMMRTIVQGLQTTTTSTGEGGFEQLLQMGHAIAQQLGEVNPELSNQLAADFQRNPNPSARDPPNQNDSYDL